MNETPQITKTTREIEDRLRSQVFIKHFFSNHFSAKAAINSMVTDTTLPSDLSDSQKNSLAKKYLRESFHDIQTALEEQGMDPGRFARKLEHFLESWDNQLALVKLMELWAKVGGWIIDRKVSKEIGNPQAGMVKKATVERVNEKLNAMKAGYSFDEEGEVVIDVNGKFTNDTD